MAPRSCKTPQPERPPTTQDILRMWRGDRSIGARTARQYLQWIARFRRYCCDLDLVEADELTRAGAKRFQAWYARPRKIKTDQHDLPSSSIRALRRVYEVMNIPVPPWRPIERHPPPALAVLRDYATHLARHRGSPEDTVNKRLDHISKLLKHLVASGKSWRSMRLPGLDAFLIDCARRYARSTVADIAGSVRSFSRFLLFSGRIDVDLADAVISPVQPRFERPRRALPWDDVQRLLMPALI